MAAGSTYTPIATTTLGSAAASYTFSSISGSYTDLRLIVAGTLTSLEDIGIQFNGDTGSNYSITNLIGDGSTASSGRQSNQTVMLLGALDGTSQSVSIFDFMNYSNATTYKTGLNRSSAASWAVFAKVGLWRSTAAITSIKVMPNNNFTAGTTLTLYGISCA
jgi:hypothetical protein